VSGEVGVETLMTRRLEVLVVMPKRRKDSAILEGVRFGGMKGEVKEIDKLVMWQ
jgi:hypothetical protein